MDLTALVYNACMAALLVYALAAGGREERGAAVLNTAASVVSYAATPDLHRAFADPELPLFGIDLLAAAGFLLLMLASRKFWPIWAFAFAAAGPMATLARLLAPHARTMAYFAVEGFWPYGTMAAITLGIMARRRPWLVLPL